MAIEKIHLIENQVAQTLDKARETHREGDGESKVLGEGVALAEVLVFEFAGESRRPRATHLHLCFPF